MTTTAIGLNGAEDAMTEKVRGLKNSKMVNQQTVKGNNEMIAPDFSLSGQRLFSANFTLSKSEQEIKLLPATDPDQFKKWSGLLGRRSANCQTRRWSFSQLVVTFRMNS